MHESVHEWIGQKVDQYGLVDQFVLEVGSYNVNGTVRDWFTGPYVGIDIRQGPQVDMVASSHHIPFRDNVFDVVLSCEVLEHDPFFWVSMREVGRVLKPGGHLLLTTRGFGFPQHDYPWDLWRFSLQTVPILLSEAALIHVESQEDPQDEHEGIFLVGRKSDLPDSRLA